MGNYEKKAQEKPCEKKSCTGKNREKCKRFVTQKKLATPTLLQKLNGPALSAGYGGDIGGGGVTVLVSTVIW